LFCFQTGSQESNFSAICMDFWIIFWVVDPESTYRLLHFCSHRRTPSPYNFIGNKCNIKEEAERANEKKEKNYYNRYAVGLYTNLHRRNHMKMTDNKNIKS